MDLKAWVDFFSHRDGLMDLRWCLSSMKVPGLTPTTGMLTLPMTACSKGPECDEEESDFGILDGGQSMWYQLLLE